MINLFHWFRRRGPFATFSNGRRQYEAIDSKKKAKTDNDTDGPGERQNSSYQIYKSDGDLGRFVHVFVGHHVPL